MKRLLYFGYVLALLLVVAGCSVPGLGNSSNTCPSGLSPVNGSCLDAPTALFVGCMKDRGQNVSREERIRLEGALQTAARIAGGQGVVEVARNVARTEDSEVAKQFLQQCIELTRNSQVTRPTERTGLDQLEQELRDRGTGPEGGPPSIMLTPSRGGAGIPIQVTGKNWPPNAELEVRAMTNQTRATTDVRGRFSATITSPSGFGDGFFEGVNAEVIVMPVDTLLLIRSPVMRQSALYEIER